MLETIVKEIGFCSCKEDYQVIYVFDSLGEESETFCINCLRGTFKKDMQGKRVYRAILRPFGNILEGSDVIRCNEDELKFILQGIRQLWKDCGGRLKNHYIVALKQKG